MKLILRIKIKANYQQVAAGFTEQLFLALAPPFPPMKLLRFDGCKTNNIVHIKLLGIIDWVSKISEHGEDKQEIWFVDEGIKLPFFLQSWQHKHRIIAEQNNTVIVEDISYTTPFILFDYLLYPLFGYNLLIEYLFISCTNGRCLFAYTKLSYTQTI